MGVVSQDVVPAGQQVVSLHQLQGKPSGEKKLARRGVWGAPRRRRGWVRHSPWDSGPQGWSNSPHLTSDFHHWGRSATCALAAIWTASPWEGGGKLFPLTPLFLQPNIPGPLICTLPASYLPLLWAHPPHCSHTILKPSAIPVTL